MAKLLLIFLCVHTAFAKLKWVELKPSSGSVPVARRDSSIGYDPTTNRVIIFGGRSGSTTLGDTWIFDLANRTWTKVAETRPDNVTSIPKKRFSMVYGAAKGGFYVSTGEFQGGGKTSFYNDILRFDFQRLTWSLIEPKSNLKPEVRYGSGGGIHPQGNGFYVSHGFAGERYSNTLKFDIKTKKWETMFGGTNSYNPSYPHSRCLHGSAMTAPDEFVMYGGCLGGGGTGGPCPSQDGWKFDVSGKRWTKFSQCPSPRLYSAMALVPSLDAYQKRVVLYGGIEKTGSVLSTSTAPAEEVILLYPDKEIWKRKKIEGTVPVKRSGHVMATAKTGIVMFGGVGNGKHLNDLWLLMGDVGDADKSDNLECDSHNFNLIMLHGIFMFIGWGILLQGGAFVARYFRLKDPWWFKMHIGFQVSGLLFAIAGFICAVVSVPFDHFAFAHGWIGLDIMIIGILQPLNAVFRPHKGADGSRGLKRIIWEWYHKLVGRLALIMALLNISLGLFLAVVPTAAWAVWYGLLGIILLLYVVMETRLRAQRSKTGCSDIPMEIK